MDWAKFTEYGLIGLTIGVLFFMAWRRDVWIMAFVKEMTAAHNKERECWNDTYNKINKSIEDHSAQTREFHSSVHEAHRYAREEHEKMIGQLDEITITLGRINGYK
jgi:hypothetical protein